MTKYRSNPASHRSSSARSLRELSARAAAIFALLGGALLATAAAGCEGKTCEEQGGVTIDGVCEGKCDASKCLEGNVCSENRCVLVCTSHADCIEGQECAPAKADDGSDILACLYTKKTENIGLSCPKGDECNAFSACPDGSACSPDAPGNCAPEECRPMACFTAGVGDAYAYCTTLDCKTDDDCVGGMECRVKRTPQKICGTQIGTEDPCIDPADFATNGATYQQGPVSLLQNVCAKRRDCSPCETDLDCDLEPDQSCVNINGSLRCARGCAVAKDCEDDHDCVSGFCIPKFGGCTGNGNFCEPCNTDLDCAAGGPTMACYQLQGEQRACIDASFSTACSTDADCPTSPSGKHGHCFTTAEVDPPLAKHCFAPFQAATSKFKCW